MKRKVLVLGSELDYIDKQYYDEFKKDYEVQVRIRSPEWTRRVYHRRADSVPFRRKDGHDWADL